MSNVHTILMLAGAGCFAAQAFFPTPRVVWWALGVAFLIVAQIASGTVGIS